MRHTMSGTTRADKHVHRRSYNKLQCLKQGFNIENNKTQTNHLNGKIGCYLQLILPFIVERMSFQELAVSGGYGGSQKSS